MYLPIEAMRSSIIELIRCHQVTIVVGETGSGKTTKLPCYLYEAGFAKDGMIVVTEPRRLAVVSVASYVAKELNTGVGRGVVGYKVRFDDSSNQETALKFMTDGILLRELQIDPLLSKYSLIVLDEAHERSVNIDLLLGLLKKILTLREDLKLVVASATIDAEKFSRYYGNAPVVNIEGRRHEVAVISDKNDWKSPQEILQRAVAKIHEIHQRDKLGDILVFLPGLEEIREVTDALRRKRLAKMVILPAHGDLSPEQQQAIFEKYSGKRKVVLATNIAETSITIDGIVYVIDTGLVKQTEFDPVVGIQSLGVVEHSQAGCNQRAGRAGRTQPGICYRLFTTENFNERPLFTEPEIRRVSLASTVLAMEALEIPDIKDFDFIDHPPPGLFEEAYETLEALGALNKGTVGLTKLGEEMTLLPLEPRIAYMVLGARYAGCVEDVATIAAFLSCSYSVFLYPVGRKSEALAAHQRFKSSQSDMLTFLNIWREYEQKEFDLAWCVENFLGARSLEEVGKVRDQLLRHLRRLGIKVAHSSDESVIMRTVASGFSHNLVMHVGKGIYQGVLRRLEKVRLHQGSAVVNGADYPRWLVAARIAATPNVKAYDLSQVIPEWLPEIAPNRFSFGERVLKVTPGETKGKTTTSRAIVFQDHSGQMVEVDEVIETVSEDLESDLVRKIMGDLRA